MALKIEKIYPESLAEKHGLQQGDLIVSINDHEIRDFVDLQFYAAESELKIKYRTPKKEDKTLTIIQDWSIQLGIEPTAHTCRDCINNCIFCFIDQMRPGLRKSLFVKDDDYIFSFVYGNYITLTNLTERDFSKIVEQKISPLYISVHTTNPDLHKKMMRYKKDFNILEKLKHLSENGIELHTQIVIVPDWNDKKELEQTLIDLTSNDLNVSSIGLVPVGLTKFRENLNILRPATKDDAIEYLNLYRKYCGDLNHNQIFCSDEIYLLADEKIPDDSFYEDYSQIENGIGMVRMLLENWKFSKEDFLNEIEEISNNLVFVTGTLAFSTVKQISDEINKHFNHSKTRVKAITNHFLGETVTVTGLLSGIDIKNQLDLSENEIPVFSSNIFNTDELTLDQMGIEDFLEFYQRNLIIVNELFEDWDFVDIVQ